ncbi:MAG TPA: bacillithiol biosynthesis cysteine-adding enzyme BshC [Gemmatimonadales bacterium]|nr:bacillithiol biosynthesis cysteine-adding enzyme BshC [Gemmatimonadales bacterium]
MTSSLRIERAPVLQVPEPPIRFAGLATELRAAFAPGAARDRLFRPEAVVVTTGQQPGLFGGPLYTVHKALAARALARELEARWHRPVVPVFWVAGDDHDWAEASSATWWTARDEVRHGQLEARPDGAPQLPMSRTPVPEAALVRIRDALAGDLAAGPGRERALDWIDRHWRAPATMASAFLGGIQELLDPLGIAVLDPTHAVFKRAQQSPLRLALERSDEIDRALASLPDAGTGITAGDGATLVFLESADGRDRLVRDASGRFATRRSGESFARADLLALLDTAPERFSANVLLRPVVEAALLPTVAYVAGPGEARYLTHQAHAVYPLLEVTPQRVIPRWQGTIVDATTDRLLRRLGCPADQIIGGGRELERELLMRDMPLEAVSALATLERTIEETGRTLVRAGTSIDAVLDRAIQGRTGRMLGITRDLGDLLRRHLKRREDIAWSQYQRLRHRLVPDDAPQERVITVAAALGVWGQDWMEAVARATEQWARVVLEASSHGA